MSTIKITKGAVAKPGTTLINLTGSWRTFRPRYDFDKCIGCGICSGFCPEGCIVMLERKNKDGEIEKKYLPDYDYCKGCGICAENCPKEAVEMVLEEDSEEA